MLTEKQMEEIAEETGKYKDRKFRLLIYPEDASHAKALEYIKQNYDYACILHDRDIVTQAEAKENPKLKAGEIKKPHWHVVVKVANPKWNTALANELEITDNYIKKCDKLDDALLYLVHAKNPEKARYDIDEVEGQLKVKLAELLNKMEKGEGEKVCEILDYIDNHKGKLTVSEFARYCASNGYWAEFRRAGAILCRIIDEKNGKELDERWKQIEKRAEELERLERERKK